MLLMNLCLIMRIVLLPLKVTSGLTSNKQSKTQSNRSFGQQRIYFTRLTDVIKADFMVGLFVSFYYYYLFIKQFFASLKVYWYGIGLKRKNIPYVQCAYKRRKTKEV